MYIPIFLVAATTTDYLKVAQTRCVISLLLTQEIVNRLVGCTYWFKKLSGMFRCQDTFYLCLNL